VWPERLGSDVALCHGSPRSDIEYLLETPVGEAARLATSAEIEERLDGHIAPHVGLLACGHSICSTPPRFTKQVSAASAGDTWFE